MYTVFFSFVQTEDPVDCADHMAQGTFDDGVYKVMINNNAHLVFCDMTTDGGGWTVCVGLLHASPYVFTRTII